MKLKGEICNEQEHGNDEKTNRRNSGINTNKVLFIKIIQIYSEFERRWTSGDKVYQKK